MRPEPPISPSLVADTSRFYWIPLRLILPQEAALCVKQLRVQLHRLARLEHHFGRGNLHPGRLALTRLENLPARLTNPRPAIQIGGARGSDRSASTEL